MTGHGARDVIQNVDGGGGQCSGKFTWVMPCPTCDTVIMRLLCCDEIIKKDI